jgi:hypothetical protein
MTLRPERAAQQIGNTRIERTSLMALQSGGQRADLGT